MLFTFYFIGDAITIYIELKYKRDPKTKNRNVVHAPYFPMLLNDSWQLSLTKADDDFCISSTKVSSSTVLNPTLLMMSFSIMEFLVSDLA
jgi:hypothetical protein